MSALDFSNAITISGFRVPSLTARRTDTQIELRDGQTFAIAGLIDNTVTETMSKIPGLGDIPILGLLFKSRVYQKNQTELVVMITPHIVRRDSPGVAPQLPDLVQPFLDPPDETLPPPPASQFGADRSGGTQDVAASVLSRDGSSASSEAIPAVVTAIAPVASGSATAIRTTLDPRAERKRLERERKQAEKTRKAEEKLAREEAARAAKAERKRLERERKQAEKTRKAEEKLAREEAARAAKAEQKRLEVARKQAEKTRKAEEKLAREQAKHAAENAARAAKAGQKRIEEERKQAEKTRKAEEKVAREEAKRVSEDAKRAAEQAARIAKAEQKRSDAARKQAEKNRKEEERRALAQALADAKRYEREWKQAEKERETLARERAKRQGELDRVLAEFQQKVGSAQRALDEIDRAQQELRTEKPETDSGLR